MAHLDKMRLHLHSVALLMEATGTFLVFCDTVRMNAQLHGIDASYTGGPPPGYRGWVYHQATAGFCFLFGGIILAGIVLWLEHRAMLNKLSSAPTAQPPATNVTPNRRTATPPA
jgi:hypothetical protein